MTPEEARIVEKIINTQRNIKVFGGIAIGMILSIYFFTFAMVLDRAPPIFITVQAITALIFVSLFFVGNRVSFLAARLVLPGRAYKSIFRLLRPDDVVMDLDQLKTTLDQRRDRQTSG